MPYTVTGLYYKPEGVTPDRTTTSFGGGFPQAPSDARSQLIRNPKNMVTGWREPSPYSRVIRSPGYWQGRVVAWSNSYGQHLCSIYDGTAFTPSSPSNLIPLAFDNSIPSVPTSYASRAEVEALVKLKDLKVNYAIALTELGKSAKLIEQSLWHLYDAYRAARKRQWKKVLRILKIPRHKWRSSTADIGGRWLEVVYGWLPFLGDIHGAYEDGRSGIIDLRTRLAVVRDYGQPLKQHRSTPVVVRGSIPSTLETRETGRMGCRVRLDYRINDDALRTASRTGLTNPYEVAWNLVPFSFVADWLVPISDWLSALDAPKGLVFLGGTRTNYVKFSRKQRINGAAQTSGPLSRPGLRRTSWCDVKGAMSVVSTHRAVYDKTPFPTPFVRSPFSTARALNLAALLSQLVKKPM